MGLTDQLAEFICQTEFETFPARAVSIAKLALLDSIGVAMAPASCCVAAAMFGSRTRSSNSAPPASLARKLAPKGLVSSCS